MGELETGEIEFESAGEFLAEIRREFGGGDEESVKVAKLKKIEQGGRTMEEFVQDFKRVARGSGYEGRPLIEEFKQGMNGSIRRKLMEAENQPATIEHWFKRAIALDRNWRESKREEERLRGKKETNGAPTPRLNQQGAFGQSLQRPQVWPRRQETVKIIKGGLCAFLFSLSFIFLFLFLFFLLFSISIFRTTQVRGYQSRCHISHKLMA